MLATEMTTQISAGARFSVCSSQIRVGSSQILSTVVGKPRYKDNYARPNTWTLGCYRKLLLIVADCWADVLRLTRVSLSDLFPRATGVERILQFKYLRSCGGNFVLALVQDLARYTSCDENPRLPVQPD